MCEQRDAGRLTEQRGAWLLLGPQRRGSTNFFATRVVNVWNFLPEDVVNFSTPCSFKNSLNSVDVSRFLTFIVYVLSRQ